MKSLEIHYIDTNVLIGYLNSAEEPDNAQRCNNIIRLAKEERLILITSTLTLVEVASLKSSTLSEDDQEKIIVELFLQSWLRILNLDRKSAELARVLVREHRISPMDAAHIGTAIQGKSQYFNTFDQKLIKVARNFINVPLIFQNPPLPEGQMEIF